MATGCSARYRVRSPRGTPLYRLFETHFDEERGLGGAFRAPVRIKGATQLGECRTMAGLYSPAEDLLLPGHAILGREFGEEHPRTAAITRRLVDLYEAWDKPDRAELWRARLPGLSE